MSNIKQKKEQLEETGIVPINSEEELVELERLLRLENREELVDMTIFGVSMYYDEEEELEEFLSNPINSKVKIALAKKLEEGLNEYVSIHVDKEKNEISFHVGLSKTEDLENNLSYHHHFNKNNFIKAGGK